MKDLSKSVLVYSAAFIASAFVVAAASEFIGFIDNPYSSLRGCAVAAVFLVPLMVLFDRIFIAGKRR